MRTFNVNVNGVLYQVEVEVGYGYDAAKDEYCDMIDRGIIDPTKVTRSALQNAASVAAMVLTTESLVTDIPAPEPAAPAGKGETINAPMPGNILDVRVANGQAVTAGQILMILEAMKMENEIIAPCAGTVSNLSVQKGSTVSSGQLLCSIG